MRCHGLVFVVVALYRWTMGSCTYLARLFCVLAVNCLSTYNIRVNRKSRASLCPCLFSMLEAYLDKHFLLVSLKRKGTVCSVTSRGGVLEPEAHGCVPDGCTGQILDRGRSRARGGSCRSHVDEGSGK